MGPGPNETTFRNASSTLGVDVWASVRPESVVDVQEAMRRSAGRVSVSGARFSPDTQFALEGALHLDLSRLDRIVRLEPLARTVTVQAGARWAALLQFLLPHDLVPRVMPMYANFSVGGSVASNRIGPYAGAGPVGEGVRSLLVVLADGSLRRLARDEDPDGFKACVGGFGGTGIIVEVELELAENSAMLRKLHSLDADQYPDFLRARVLTDPGAIMHRAELDPADLASVRAETWVASKTAVNWPQKLYARSGDDPLARIAELARAGGPLARAAIRLFVDPLRAMRRSVHWRSLEASADIRSLDPQAQVAPRQVFQTYAVPLDGFQPFLRALRRIADEHRLPLSTATILHLGESTSSHLPMIAGEGVAIHLVLRPEAADDARDPNDAERDFAVWTRELVQAALDCGGGFDPGYRMHATREQFARAFPGSGAMALAKQRLDPRDRLGNGFWNRYFGTEADAGPAARPADAAPGLRGAGSEFAEAMARETVRDGVYRMLCAVAPAGLGPRVFRLLQAQCRRNDDDELIYRALSRALSKWRQPWHARLAGRRADWLEQMQPRLAQYTLATLAARSADTAEGPDGVLEFGTAGTHLETLRHTLRPRGELMRFDGFGLLARRAARADAVQASVRALAARALPARVLPDPDSLWSGLPKAPEVLDLVVVHAGLAQLPAPAQARLLASVSTSLRRGGVMILLEHDADSAQSALEASVFARLTALCEGSSWRDCAALPMDLRPADEWGAVLAAHGLVETGTRERIARSPLGDVLMAFTRR
ncbi:MAG: FAD-binding oxidoreductase [Lautropia sp.]